MRPQQARLPLPTLGGDDLFEVNRKAPGERRQRTARAAKLVACAVAISAAAAAVSWSAPSVPLQVTPKIGEPAPALVLTAIDGRTFDLAKLRGKVVMVNYWATWCAPCRKEMPQLDAFYRRYRSKGLEIVGISIDFDRDLDKARKVAQTVTYPTAFAKSIADNGFGVTTAVPVTWIIDVDGKVRDRFIEVRDELLDGIVVPLLPH